MRPHPASASYVVGRHLPRTLNRRLALDLIRARQPVSRADLARLMNTRRSAVTVIVTELIAQGLVFEGATGQAPRGRKPTFLYIDSRKRCVMAVDVRPTRTSLMVTDLLGQPVGAVSSFATVRDPDRFAATLGERIVAMLTDHRELGRCEGIGVVVPGMVDRDGARVMFAPRLGWQDVALAARLTEITGLPATLENSGRACALAELWAAPDTSATHGDFVVVNVSDGLGIGVVVRGELLRGRHNVAGEFGHTPLNVEGPMCACGARGCWEAYVSNLATLSRYFGRELSARTPLPREIASFTIDDLIARARGGDGKATAALQATAHYLGLGLATLVNALDPSRIIVGGELVAAWDLLGPTVRQALLSRALVPTAADIEIVPLLSPDNPRLRGAAALAAAPRLAASLVA